MPRTISAADTLGFLKSLVRPGAPPAWVVLDNGNIHRSLHIRHALPTLARQGVHLFFLPMDAQGTQLPEATVTAMTASSSTPLSSRTQPAVCSVRA